MKDNINKKERKVKFPKNFFNTSRPNVSLEETLKDITPIKWQHDNKKEVIVHLTHKKKSN